MWWSVGVEMVAETVAMVAIVLAEAGTVAGAEELAEVEVAGAEVVEGMQKSSSVSSSSWSSSSCCRC